MNEQRKDLTKTVLNRPVAGAIALKTSGACLALAIQAWEWLMNPFAVANKSYVVNDRLAYESALYNAVATRRAPIEGRLQISYEGEGPTRSSWLAFGQQRYNGTRRLRNCMHERDQEHADRCRHCPGRT